MPEGPFDFPRFTCIGPLTEQTDVEVSRSYLEMNEQFRTAEAAVPRTIIDLDNVTGAGRIPVVIDNVSLIFQFGNTALYEVEEERIVLSYEPFILANMEGGNMMKYLKALVAHEYSHRILGRPDVESIIKDLADDRLFNHKDIENTVEFYDFPPEQYVEYDSLDEFIDHITQFSSVAEARPVEGFSNVLATRYAQMTFREYSDMKSQVRAKADELQQKAMKGDVDIPKSEVTKLPIGGWDA